jgi:antitoxin PrlF
MDVAAKITSKGQVTVPKSVRDALGVKEGDVLVFRVQGRQATIAVTPDILDLAGVVPVPDEVRDEDWSEVRARAWQARSARVAERRVAD